MSPPQSERTGVLVLNLGTPDDPSVPAVRRYLREFLSDPDVIDLPAPLRFLLLNAVILPFRPKKSAAAYRLIWEPEGSPLLLRTLDFAAALQDELGPDFDVETGMRYGNPSVASGLAALRSRGINRLIAFPLYAQSTASSTGSVLKELRRVLAGCENAPALEVIPAFHDEEAYLSAMAARVHASLADGEADHVLFCFHGIPERHVRREDQARGACLESADCCAEFSSANSHCYRAQCYQTARRVAQGLALEIPWSVAFQSRLGRTPWLAPYADHVVDDLARSGTKRLVVVPTSFLCDCLETLEELGLRAKESFLAHGGEELRLVPALNASSAWVSAAAGLVRRRQQAERS